MNIRVPCRYAILQFMPYPETGEFANIGVVLVCPQMRYLGAKLAPPRRTKRVTDFFEGLEARIYREAVRYIEGDLKRLSDDVIQGRMRADYAFEEIARPREVLIRCGSIRTIMSSGHPSETLQALYERFVERDFATKEYHETQMRNRLDEMLVMADLKNYFVEATVGDDLYPVRFPFVNANFGRPTIAIKPLNLCQDEPYRIFEHGNAWLGRIDRLRKHGNLPKTVLFAVDQPKEGLNRIKAAAEIARDLRTAGALVEPLAHTDTILGIARQAQPS